MVKASQGKGKEVLQMPNQNPLPNFLKRSFRALDEGGQASHLLAL